MRSGLPVAASERHRAAVASSLQWAEESAARGDHQDALGWLQVIEAAGDELPHGHQIKRRAWLLAAEDRGKIGIS